RITRTDAPAPNSRARRLGRTRMQVSPEAQRTVVDLHGSQQIIVRPHAAASKGDGSYPCDRSGLDVVRGIADQNDLAPRLVNSGESRADDLRVRLRSLHVG